MNGYMIVKNVKGWRTPYAGPCCARAGVRPGQIYLEKPPALKDCAKLQPYSAIGFTVVPYAPAKGR